MEGLNEFIVEVGKAFRDTIKHGTLELYTEYLSKQQEQSNRQGIAISLPLQVDSEIEEGAEVIIDPTVLFQQTYKGKMQESRYLVNKEKGWYRLTPDMIILYKNPGDTEWSGHRQNLFVKLIKDEDQVTESGIIIGIKKGPKKGIGEVAFSNKELREDYGVNTRDIVYFPSDLSWEFELEGEKYVYVRNFDLLAKAV